MLLYTFTKQHRGSYSYVPSLIDEKVIFLLNAAAPFLGTQVNLEKDYFQKFTPLAELGIIVLFAIQYERERGEMGQYFRLLKFRRKDDDPGN